MTAVRTKPVAVCVALTRFPRHTGSLYAADLAGSAAGCLLTIPILNHIHAPTAVILNAAIAAVAAIAFSLPVKGVARNLSIVSCVGLIFISGINQNTKWIDIKWIKGGRNWGDGLYEKWNALSRIYVRETGSDPFGWGMSPAYEPKRKLDVRTACHSQEGDEMAADLGRCPHCHGAEKE